MGRYATFRQTAPFKHFRKVMSKIYRERLEYPCEKCIVDACCVTACEVFEMWLNRPSKYKEEKQ